jgi:hypothetical protein
MSLILVTTAASAVGKIKNCAERKMAESMIDNTFLYIIPPSSSVWE